MSVNLTVIIGAGAAHDVVNPESNDVKYFTQKRFRPPITANLFDTDFDWEDEYKKFPAVESVVVEIRNAFPDPNKRNSFNIEQFLKGLKDSPKAHRRAVYREFPLYLQHFFTAVSERYCRKPSNYNILIHKIFDLDLNKVVFVTTNYDLLFDKALHHHPAIQGFSISDPNMNKYITDEKWAYIKLHGSVDWGKKIKDNMIKNKSNTIPGLVDNVKQLGDVLESALESDIIRDFSYNQEDKKEIIYPAISVPIGERKLNCRREHIDKLREHLNNCQHFLIIGFSGYDKDILDLLDNKEGGFNRVLFVSSSENGARDAQSNFLTYGNLGGKLNNTEVSKANGFDEFIRRNDGLDAYLKSLR